MRTTMIVIQAAILSLLAVFGAQGESGTSQTCPLPTATADLSCHDTGDTAL